MRPSEFCAVNRGPEITTIDLDGDGQKSELSLRDIVMWLDDPKKRISSYQVLPEYLAAGLPMFPGTEVKLQDGSFFRIKFIVHETLSSEEGRVRFYGHMFILTGSHVDIINNKDITHHQDSEDLSHLIPGMPNEVCWLVNAWEEGSVSQEVQEFKAIDPEKVTMMVDIKITNQLCPKLNTLVETGAYKEMDEDDFHDCPLICRYKIIRRWLSLDKAKQGCFRHCSKTIERIRPTDTDAKCGVSDKYLLNLYRSPTVPRGNHFGILHSERRRREQEADVQKRAIAMHREQGTSYDSLDAGFDHTTELLRRCTGAENRFEIVDTDMVIDLEEDECDYFWESTSRLAQGLKLDLHKQRYSFGDMFGGAGGVSRAAVLAGLAPIYMVDKDKGCCSTYSTNFPGTKVACVDVFKFIWNSKYNKLVDILHMSNPCQPFARCHTVEGRNDRVNQQCLSTIEEMLRKARPRIVTIENSDGLYAIQKHKEFFDSLMRQFLAEGYSIQVKVVNFADYGVPQSRHRMIVMASCPGQQLPGFPEPTHSKDGDGGLKPYNTINSAIQPIPWPWNDHHPERMKLFAGEPFSGDKLSQTLVCSNYAIHPDGFRNYTTRELACLQTFPLYHEFDQSLPDRAKEKQIGNAVPPAGFAPFLEHIKRRLLVDDGWHDDSAILID